MGQHYAGIIIDRAHPSLDRVFHYGIPDALREKIGIGQRVLVPFGRQNKLIEGYVVELGDKIDVPLDKIKYINRAADEYPLLSPKFIPMIWWMKEEYHCLTIEAIRCFIPPGLRVNIKEKTQRVVFLELEDDVDEAIRSIERRSSSMAEILRIMKYSEGVPVRELLELTGASASSISSLEKRGWIRVAEEETYREPWSPKAEVTTSPPELTEEQRKAFQTIEAALQERRANFLIHGVTGSGKTEVYIRAVQTTLMLGKQAIVLVPEISLTPQTVGRFKARFGEQVAILHSGLSLGERFDEWRKIRNQEVSIVVGARSAIFAPLKNLGLIVIDEVHEDSYKSDVSPRYHAVGIAKKRCELENAVLVLGTATPTVEDYYLAGKGDYRKIEMNHRVNQRALPPVELVDMRQEIEKGNRSIFSQPLYEGIEKILQSKEQAILLLNRRGYAQFVSCRSCGFVMKCHHCDISLTYHADGHVLKCHYCSRQYAYPSVCPSCKSRYIKHFGIGTQRVEEEINRFFPQARIVRMDMDTTSRKGAHERILSDFREGKYDILLGTQMIAKGLDFPRVTLVGVIAADTSLNLPEYRSSEKTFQLVTQVAGRAGRGSAGGKVVIQTYQPDHYAIDMASRHDVKGFYDKELEIRQQFGYPPFSHIVRIMLTGEKEEALIDSAHSVEAWLRNEGAKRGVLAQGIEELGAFPAPLEKIKSKYRWQILIRIRTEEIFKRALHQLIDECFSYFSQIEETMIVDFYPVSLL